MRILRGRRVVGFVVGGAGFGGMVRGDDDIFGCPRGVRFVDPFFSIIMKMVELSVGFA
jgi:hypothetical protein